MVRIISGGLGELVRPCVDDGITIDVLDTCRDALFEFVFRGHSDVAQDRAGELGEEAFDEVEPGAVLGREGELEAAGRLGSEPSSRFSGDVRGMIVEDQLDRGTRRISRIEKLEELDELSAAVAVSDQGMDLAGEQINPGQQAERAVTLVLMITREGRMDIGFRRQIRRRRCDGLNSRFFVVGDDRHRLVWFLRLGGGLFQDLHLAVDTQNLCHLLLERGVAAFQVVAHLMRFDFFPAEDLAHRALDQVCQTPMPRRRAVLARMTCQQPCRPQLVRIAMLLGLVARQRHQPSLGLRRDRRLLAGSRSIIEGRQRAIGHRPFDAALHGLMMHFEALSHGKERTSFRWAGLRTALDTKSRTDGGMQTAVQGYVPDC
jgi:hypothetical protein